MPRPITDREYAERVAKEMGMRIIRLLEHAGQVILSQDKFDTPARRYVCQISIRHVWGKHYGTTALLALKAASEAYFEAKEKL
jgi:hypothetical protein